MTIKRIHLASNVVVVAQDAQFSALVACAKHMRETGRHDMLNVLPGYTTAKIQLVRFRLNSHISA